MRIVIDLQGAQSCGGATRGIGRYSIAITRAIARHGGNHEVLVALNGRLPTWIESIRASLEGCVPGEAIRVWYPPTGVSFCNVAHDSRRNAAERIRESFLAALAPDVIYVTSMYEGLNEDAVTSIGVFDCQTPTAVAVYDFIPFIYDNAYLDDPRIRRFYVSKRDQLRRAGRLLTISESAREECIDHVGLPPGWIDNVSAGVDPRFRPIRITQSDEHRIRSTYRIDHRFFLYAGGFDYRKNVEGLVRAFGLLPAETRRSRQLVIVGDTDATVRRKLTRVASSVGVHERSMVFTGFVPDDELLLLYNLCEVFILPSFHEGFGLPALEAMSSGAAVIASNTASLPEVVGRSDALFDPFCVDSIAGKMAEAASNEEFREALRAHGPAQAQRFSWERSGARAIASFEELHDEKRSSAASSTSTNRRRKLAYVMPCPVRASGVADESVALLPELSRYYEIDLIVPGGDTSDERVASYYPVHDLEWLVRFSSRYDRVLYQVENSRHYAYVFDMIEQVPGVVVLNDVFLGDLLAFREGEKGKEYVWTRELYRSHGYSAVRDRYRTAAGRHVRDVYPCTTGLMQKAIGVVVRSDFAKTFLVRGRDQRGWEDVHVVPSLIAPKATNARLAARRRVDVNSKDFVVCCVWRNGSVDSFHKLIQAWRASDLAQDGRCRLIVLAGEDVNEPGDSPGESLIRDAIDESVTIVNGPTQETSRDYLSASDVVVLFSGSSRGDETVRLLDCMSYEAPVIVDEAELIRGIPGDAVVCSSIDDDSDNLAGLLSLLRVDDARREEIVRKAREYLRYRHVPRHCADDYSQAIESAYYLASKGRFGLIESLANVDGLVGEHEAVTDLAKSISLSFPATGSMRQLLVDVSELVQRDAGTGIQRVTRQILERLLSSPPPGFRIEPVYATTDSPGYRYARKFTLSTLDCDPASLDDELVEAVRGDIFVGLDLQPHVVPAQREYLRSLYHRGVRTYFVVYDLLPVVLPEGFGEPLRAVFSRWLHTVTAFDGAICISRTVADELSRWLRNEVTGRLTPFRIGWFHLGADIPATNARNESLVIHREVLAAMEGCRCFLMVGTIEPRKGHEQVLAAFEELWRNGHDVRLVIVGRPGWMMESFVELLKGHSANGNRFWWLNDVDDGFLEEIYARSTCLLAVSKGEGFGLPLIEAARHGVPIIARDIPVFREVARENAYYFSENDGQSLSMVLEDWLRLHEQNRHPDSHDLPWSTWSQSVEKFTNIVLEEDWYIEVGRADTAD